MQLLNLETTTTMSSREMAELTGKNHADVMRDIRKMLKDLEKDQSTFADIFLDAYNRSQPMFSLPYDETVCLLTGYDAKARMAVIKRWKELEAKQVSEVFKVPQTLSEALRLAADQQDTIVAQAAQLAIAAPAVAFVEKYVETKSSKCLSDVAKILGKKPQSFIQILAADGVLFKRGGSWLPAQSYLDDGKFTVKTGDASGHAYHQTRVEPKGIEWLARAYAQ